MKFFSLILLAFTISLSQSELSDRFTTFEEIETQLSLWNEEFGNNTDPYNYPGEEGIIYHQEIIGYSSVDSLPIWAVKLSFNADQNLDKPKVLILGQCHAEEIYGVEISMELINRLLNPLDYPAQYQSIYAIMQNSEIWVVPTYNPDGFNVVHGWYENDIWSQDIYYRKNKYDANSNQVFDFVVGPGDDVDGVDLNRNYDLNWFFGDDLDVADGGSCNPSYITNFDYYRGPAPFSETEVQAIRDFAIEKNFLLSIAYHSSRSGCVAEKVIYPWEWSPLKPSPDFPIISRLGIEIAELIPKEVEAGTYYPVGSQSRKGNAHDWMYLNTGCFQYLIEVGSENIQPNDIELIETTINNNIEGAIWLLKRAAGTNIQNGPDLYQITGIVTDANSGQTIQAEVIIHELNGPMLEPRYTDSFGRYRRLLIEGTYTIEFKAFGYESHIYTFVPSSSQMTEYDIALLPIEIGNLVLDMSFPDYYDESFNVIVEGDNFFDNSSYALGEQFNPDNFQLSYSLPVGEYSISIYSNNLFPEIRTIQLTNSDLFVDLYLKWKSVNFHESFDDLHLWSQNIGWFNFGSMLMTNSDLLYSNSQNNYISTTLDLNNQMEDSSQYVIRILSKHEFEWEHDYVTFTLESDNFIDTLATLTNHSWEYLDRYIPFNAELINDNATMKINFYSDDDLNYRGLYVDEINILYKSIDECYFGDVDLDGSIDINDIVKVVEFIIQNMDLLGIEKCISDYNDDQIINVVDIIAIINIILDIEN